jgi:tetratricopeptide (TPR) repeat protein
MGCFKLLMKINDYCVAMRNWICSLSSQCANFFKQAKGHESIYPHTIIIIYFTIFSAMLYYCKAVKPIELIFSYLAAAAAAVLCSLCSHFPFKMNLLVGNKCSLFARATLPLLPHYCAPKLFRCAYSKQQYNSLCRWFTTNSSTSNNKNNNNISTAHHHIEHNNANVAETAAAPSTLREWNDFNSAGLRYINQGKLAEASSMFIAAMRDPSAAEAKGPYIHLSLANLAIVHRLQANLRDSDTEFRYAVAHLAPFHAQLKPTLLAQIYRNFGLTLELGQKFMEAQKQYEIAANLYQNYLNSDAAKLETGTELVELTKELAGCLYGVALMLEAQVAVESNVKAKGELMKRAEAAFVESVSAAEKAYSSDSVNVAEVHKSKAQFYLSNNEVELAQEEYLKAIDIYQRVKSPALHETLKLYLSTVVSDPQQVEYLMETLVKK